MDIAIQVFGIPLDAGILLALEQQTATSGMYDGIYDVSICVYRVGCSTEFVRTRKLPDGLVIP